MKNVFVYLLPLLISSIATADISVSQFKESKARGSDEWGGIELYVTGLGTGFMTANAELKFEHKPLLYCQPGKLSLDTNNYVEMIEKEIAERKPDDSMWLSIVLLSALQSIFPCPTK
jgi:hypothetical protein